MDGAKRSKAPAERTEEEKVLIRKAVQAVMRNENISEPRAYKLIQRKAMSQRETMVAVAQRYLSYGQLEPTPRG
jgi:AmiR/NasT family two-component response regulator